MELTEWLLLLLLTLLAIGSLLFASSATDSGQSVVGLLIAAGAVAGIFYRMKQYFDRVDATHRH